MAGEAKTNEFLLTTATVMLGPSEDVFGLVPDLHSIGLVKNVQVNGETSFVELTQGIQNAVVAAVNTGNQTRISAEVYEYTARNLAYGAYLDGTLPEFDAYTDNVYELANDSTSATGTSIALATGDGTDFVAGDYVILQDDLQPDKVHVGKVASKATDTLTLTAGTAIPAATSFLGARTTVRRVHGIKFGSVAKQPTYGAKLVGLLPESGEPVTLIFPKVKVTKGLSLAFQTDNFSNMPFEFTPYALTLSDAHYGEFGSTKTWALFRS